MPTVDAEWRAIHEGSQRFWSSLRQSTSVNVNSANLKTSIRTTIQRYFRSARPELLAIGFHSDDLDTLDAAFQELLRLTNGNNARSSYVKRMRAVRAEAAKISGKLELLLGTKPAADPRRTPIEEQIIATLQGLVPSAALSYEQALSDLNDTGRVSFRGPAVELREAMREVLDHLAPDDAVMKSDGFKLDRDRAGPTFRQKVHFILHARGRTRTAIAAPQDTAETIERGVGELARSVYNRGSLSTHISSTRREVAQVKRYVEAVLSDILEL